MRFGSEARAWIASDHLAQGPARDWLKRSVPVAARNCGFRTFDCDKFHLFILRVASVDMDFVSHNIAMPIQVQGTPLREDERDISQPHEEVQIKNGQSSQNEHTVTNGEGVQLEEDATLSTHHHEEDKVTVSHGSEPTGLHQEGDHHEDESKRISHPM